MSLSSEEKILSTWKTESAGFPETPKQIYKATRHHIPDYSNLTSLS